MSKENPGLSRGFCFAEFYNHAAAAAAKNALSAPDFRWTPPLPAAKKSMRPNWHLLGCPALWPAVMAASMQCRAGAATTLQQRLAPAACTCTGAPPVLLG